MAETASVKYADLIAQSEEQKKSGQAALNVTKAKAALTVTIAQAESELAEAEIKVQQTMGAIPYKVENQINAEEELAQITKDIARAKAILDEQFN